jgi:hypothetical protein
MRERCRCGRRRGVVEFHLSGAGSLRPPAGAGPLGRGGLGLIGKDREASYRRYRCLGSWRFTSHPVGAASSSCFGRWSPGNSRCPRDWDVTTGCFAVVALLLAQKKRSRSRSRLYLEPFWNRRLVVAITMGAMGRRISLPSRRLTSSSHPIHW